MPPAELLYLHGHITFKGPGQSKYNLLYSIVFVVKYDVILVQIPCPLDGGVGVLGNDIQVLI